MKTIAGALCAMLVGALTGAPAQAQNAAPASASAVGKADSREPAIRRIVLEDDAVRIEELRVRGQTQRIVVTPKAAGAKPYEIVPAAGGHDPSQPRGNAGQRQWSVFSF